MRTLNIFLFIRWVILVADEVKDFSKYLVIFVDILGTKNRSEFKEMYQINKIFHDEFEKNQQKDMEHTVYYRKIYTFSDCAYIFYGFKDGVTDERKDISKLFTVALCNCESMFLRFLKEKIIFRGGIYYGDAYIDADRNMFFGKAVNSAYELESNVAIHPRIIVESFVAEKVLENITQVKYKLLSESDEYMSWVLRGLLPTMPETGDGIVEIDADGQYIFNYLHFPENDIVLHECYSSGKVFLEELLEYCQTQIGNNNYKVIDKYYYLIRFIKSKLIRLTE